MNQHGSATSGLVLFFRRLVTYSPNPVSSREEHEEYLRGSARKIMKYHGEGNVLLAAGKVNMGDIDFSENDTTT